MSYKTLNFSSYYEKGKICIKNSNKKQTLSNTPVLGE